jgi:predicted Na+-dependent transporter
VPFGEVLVLVVPSLLVHYALFAGGYVIARKLLDRPATQATSLAIVVSQKTLPVAIAIWSTELAERYPLALLPPMVFHAAQVYCDSLLARPWAKRMARRTEVAPP